MFQGTDPYMILPFSGIADKIGEWFKGYNFLPLLPDLFSPLAVRCGIYAILDSVLNIMEPTVVFVVISTRFNEFQVSFADVLEAFWVVSCCKLL